MKAYKNLILFCILLITTLNLMSCTNKNSMTEKDQEDVKLVISKYLQAVLDKDFEIVMELTESNQKKCCYSIKELNEKQMGIKNLKINNLKPWNGLDSSKKTPTRLFRVDLDITPNDYGSWNDGINPRFIYGVREGDEWKVSGLAESPSFKLEEFYKK